MAELNKYHYTNLYKHIEQTGLRPDGTPASDAEKAIAPYIPLIEPIQMVVAAYAGKQVANYDDYLVSESVIGATTVVGESELPQYAAKGGGGADTNAIVKNGKTVTFKHGGRHITKEARALKLNYLEAEEAIAAHVTKLDLNPGKNDFIKISFQGEIIEFRPAR